MKCGNLANEKGVLFNKQNGVKIGSIEIFARSDSAPPGYLICDGAEISRDVYKELFDIIGTTWGSGDGTTTFNLPNLIGKTIWGGHLAEVGAYKSSGLPEIIGQFRAIRAQETDDTTISGAFGFNGWGGPICNRRMSKPLENVQLILRHLDGVVYMEIQTLSNHQLPCYAHV